MKFKLMKSSFLIFLVTLFLTSNSFSNPVAVQEIYEIRVYSMKTSAQLSDMENYFKNSLIPALHKQGISKVGVFKVLGIDTATIKKIYVLTPYKSLDQWHMIKNNLSKDENFVKNSSTARPFSDVLLPSFH